MSRFDVDRFDPAPDEEFICCICQGVLDKPMETPCRHVFCKVCIETWLDNGDNKTCPTCRAAVTTTTLYVALPILNNLINKLRLHCLNRHQGCQTSWQIETFDGDHDQGCEYRTVSCKYEACRSQIIAKNCVKHEEKCEYRPYVCKKLCGLTIVAKDKATHACVPLLKETIDELKKKLADAHKDVENLTTQNNRLQTLLDHRDDASNNNDDDNASDNDSLASSTVWEAFPDDDQNTVSSMEDLIFSSSSQGSLFRAYQSPNHDRNNDSSDSMAGFSESDNEEADDVRPNVMTQSSDSEYWNNSTRGRGRSRSPAESLHHSDQSDHYAASSPVHSPPSPDESVNSHHGSRNADYDESYYSVVDSVASTGSSDDEEPRPGPSSRKRNRRSSNSSGSYDSQPRRKRRRSRRLSVYSDSSPVHALRLSSSDSSDSSDSTSDF